jgi:hypothetical protein
MIEAEREEKEGERGSKSGSKRRGRKEKGGRRNKDKRTRLEWPQGIGS